MYRKNYRPLIPWNAPKGTKHPDVAWSEKVGNRWFVEIRHAYTRCGVMVIYDHANRDAVLGEWGVSVLGPKREDVAKWRKDAASYIKERPEDA